MKKRSIFITAQIVILLLAGTVFFSACGKNKTQNPSAGGSTQDAAVVRELEQKLCGEWKCKNSEIEDIVFNEDGTGTYVGLYDKNDTFTYSVASDQTSGFDDITIHFNEADTTYTLKFLFYENGDLYIYEPSGTIVFTFGVYYKTES